MMQRMRCSQIANVTVSRPKTARLKVFKVNLQWLSHDVTFAKTLVYWSTNRNALINAKHDKHLGNGGKSSKKTSKSLAVRQRGTPRRVVTFLYDVSSNYRMASVAFVVLSL